MEDKTLLSSGLSQRYLTQKKRMVKLNSYID